MTDPLQPLGALADVVSRHGLGLGLLAAFLGGLALNLTPCVYPMIPVTLAFFGGQAAGSWRRTAWLATCYVLGLSLSYAMLGMLAARTGALFGSWLQHPAVLIGIAIVIVALSLSMFGLYDLRPPQALTNRLGQAFTGASGAFAMGLVVGLVAAPCVGPLILGLLLLVSQLANPMTGFLLFFVLGLGMGLPYLVLGMAANRIGRLPKAGVWLVWSKRALGVVLLGLALYFIWPLFPSQAPPSTPPASSTAVAWQPYSQAAFDRAQRAHQPILIDVYADWCIPCVEMDRVTFHHPDVVRALGSVTTLRVDATREVSDEAGEMLERSHVYGAPTILFFDRNGQEQEALRLSGFATPDEFLARLKQIR